MRILNDRHLTATDRRVLTAMRANGWTQAKTPRIRYTLEPDQSPEVFRLTIERSERDDLGRPVDRRYLVLLSF